MEILTMPLGYLMKLCYDVFGDYIVAILAFTVATKIILLPLAVWVHRNSIKMIEISPAINRIKAKYYGDGELIAEKQSALFKKAHYNPFASIIPLFIQIALLIGVIQVIYNPLTYLLGMSDDAVAILINQTSQLTGLSTELPSIQISVINTIQNPEFAASFMQLDLAGIDNIIANLTGLNMNLSIFDLSVVPIEVLGISTLVPVLAGISSWLLCFVQNRSNVLQSEQTAFTKYFTMIISVGISLFLGLFVPAGVAFYWVIGNLIAIIQLFALNAVIPPKKYVDYKELEESRKELAAINALGGKKKKWFEKDENAQREKTDYKKFFSIVNKKLVFYSEKSGFYKYFEGVITELLRMSNVTIHYVTSDPDDQIFELAKKEPRIKPYYIGERKLITLFMKMDADMVVMTMPDLQNFHYKRSIVRKDVHYVFLFHGCLSTHLVVRENALNHYDTVFCVGNRQLEEMRKYEEIYNLNKKNLVVSGYSLIEKSTEKYDNDILAHGESVNSVPVVVIAPSWQEDNMLDICIEPILDELVRNDYKVILRPHPEYIKRYSAKVDKLVSTYEKYGEDKISFELDFSKQSNLLSADILITDWSTVAYEFSFITKKPSVFINTPMKVLNPQYKKIGMEPLDITLRNEIGKVLAVEEISKLGNIIDLLIDNKEVYKHKIAEVLGETIANFGKAANIEARTILELLSKNKEAK